MPSSVRFVSPAQRVIYLRTLPIFGGIDNEDLALLAQAAVEQRFRRGHVLLREGEPTPAVHLLVDGEVEERRAGHPLRVFRRRDSVGVMGLLARADEGVTATALTAGMSLRLAGAELFRILEDRFSILLHVIRGVARVVEAETRALGFAEPLVHLRGAQERIAARIESGSAELDLVDRIELLRLAPTLSNASLVALSQLAGRARELRPSSGHELWSANARADCAYVVCRGELMSETRGQETSLGPGSAAGFVSLLAEHEHASSLRCIRDAVVIEVDREALLDVFEEHFGMALDTVATLARQVLRLFAQRALLSDSVPAGLAAD